MTPRARSWQLAATCLVAVLTLAGCTESTRPIPIASVEVSTPATFVEVGQTIQLSATARDASGNPLEGVQFTWLSSNEAVASVAGGVVTARGVGTATITSSAGGQEGRADITVEPVVAAMAFEPREITSASGKSVQIAQPTPDHAATASAPLLVVMRDAAGNVILRHSIRFGSSNPAVARVNETGTIELLAPGSARIVATAGQVSGELVVEVIRPYTLVALGTLGGAESRAHGINENGQIVGEACSAQQCRVPFLWENGAMTALEGGRGVAYGINDAGIIVGTNGANQGVMWQGGKLSALYGSPNTEGFTYARAYGINRAGEIVGARTGGFCTRNCPWNGFQWRGGQISEFEVFAHAINNNGQIVGFRYINMSTPQAVILENGQIRELAPLGSAAYDINDRGEAVGFSNEQGSNAFRWHNGLDTRLGVLRGRNLGRAYSINNQGHIVGASGGVGGDFSMSSPRAFLWRDGRMTDLNNLFADATWVLEEARAINDRGQIVGVGRNRTSGAAGALLLNPPQ